jgi:hypothetical protein
VDKVEAGELASERLLEVFSPAVGRPIVAPDGLDAH